MDLVILAALLLLVLWAVGTFVLALGGWIHLLLTGGLFLLIWRIVTRGTPSPSDGGSIKRGSLESGSSKSGRD